MAEQSYNNSLPPETKFLGIENRNFLSPVGFKFTISRLKGVDFFCQSANIPSINMQVVNQGTRFNKIPQPGDELYYEDLSLRFLVDENMKNWYQVHDWMRQIATPYSSREFKYKRGTLESQNKDKDPANMFSGNQWRSDCSLFILSNNYQPVAEFVFRDAFPIALTSLPFDATSQDTNYFTAECRMAYTRYDHYTYEAATATDSTMKPDYRRSEQGVVIEGL